ncbi:MAG: hypothetical protein KF684_13940 [Phycisphaeraceae bacterium]|nr:hypothetical protein [Phycisphaeraceae bacterium]
MPDERLDTLLHAWAEDERAAPLAGDAFLSRVRAERSRRRAVVLGTVGAGFALAASLAIVAWLGFSAPAASPPSDHQRADAPLSPSEPAQPVVVAASWIEPSESTMANLWRLNESRGLDDLILPRADSVAWTRTVSPLGN